jgi:hypothetical protein
MTRMHHEQPNTSTNCREPHARGQRRCSHGNCRALEPGTLVSGINRGSAGKNIREGSGCCRRRGDGADQAGWGRPPLTDSRPPLGDLLLPQSTDQREDTVNAIRASNATRASSSLVTPTRPGSLWISPGSFQQCDGPPDGGEQSGPARPGPAAFAPGRAHAGTGYCRKARTGATLRTRSLAFPGVPPAHPI